MDILMLLLRNGMLLFVLLFDLCMLGLAVAFRWMVSEFDASGFMHIFAVVFLTVFIIAFAVSVGTFIFDACNDRLGEA